MKKLKEVLICVVILAAGGGGFAALKASRPEPEPVAVAERSWLVSVLSVEPGQIAPGLLLYSRVESPTRSTMRAAIAADVLAVDIREGELVAKGQLLARLDQREVKLLVAQRKSELLQEIAAREGISEQQTIAIGDGANDLPMLNTAGLGVAYHAKPLVRQQTRYALNVSGLDGVLNWFES